MQTVVDFSGEGLLWWCGVGHLNTGDLMLLCELSDFIRTVPGERLPV
jgi:hypothetical protein